MEPTPEPPRGALKLAAACGGVGFLRPGPGTWSSAAAALPLLLPIPSWLYAPLVAVAALAAYVACVFLARRLFGDRVDSSDPGWFTLDEACGMWIAAWRPSPITPAELAAAFVAFRVADIVKPFGIARSQRARGGHGIVLDDALAGVAALAASSLLGLALR